MSLSPLYAARAKDLHVTTAAGLHRPFGRLRRGHAKVTTFRVCAGPLGELPPSGPPSLRAAVCRGRSRAGATPRSVFRDGRMRRRC